MNCNAGTQTRQSQPRQLPHAKTQDLIALASPAIRASGDQKRVVRGLTEQRGDWPRYTIQPEHHSETIPHDEGSPPTRDVSNSRRIHSPGTRPRDGNLQRAFHAVSPDGVSHNAYYDRPSTTPHRRSHRGRNPSWPFLYSSILNHARYGRKLNGV